MFSMDFAIKGMKFHQVSFDHDYNLWFLHLHNNQKKSSFFYLTLILELFIKQLQKNHGNKYFLTETDDKFRVYFAY